MVSIGVSRKYSAHQIAGCALASLPADIRLGLVSRIRLAPKTRGRLVHLLAWRQRLYDTGRDVRQASERARSLRAGEGKNAGRRAGLEARAVLPPATPSQGRLSRCCDSKHRETHTPFSAHFVPRQRDIPKASPPGDAPIQPRLRSGRIFCWWVLPTKNLPT